MIDSAELALESRVLVRSPREGHHAVLSAKRKEESLDGKQKRTDHAEGDKERTRQHKSAHLHQYPGFAQKVTETHK